MSTSVSMIQCQNCGNSNAAESQFCRFCGHQFAAEQSKMFDSSTRRPYSWQTDEYQTQTTPRTRSTIGNIEFPAHTSQSQVSIQTMYRGPQDLSGNYRCRYCGTNFLPILERRISTTGWITFALLLAFTFIFFWIGLLIKEDVPVCPVCKNRAY